MADQPAGDRTEDATPRRREKAREEGQVARSAEINSVAVLLGGLVLLVVAFGAMGAQLRALGIFYLGEVGSRRIETLGDAADVLFLAGDKFAAAMLPVALGLLLVSLLAGYAQVGWKWSNKAMSFRMEKLNPLEGIKQRFFSKTTWFELGKNLFKVFLLGIIAGIAIQGMVPELIELSRLEVVDGWREAGSILLELVLRMLAALLVLALIDLWWQRHRHAEQLKMTKDEVRRELKDQEGDPKVKARLRSLMLEQMKRRMLEDVKTADVVITNPTHFSIALRYKAAEGAPRVVAKGQGFIALKIREVAREHRIPLIENPPLARALYRTAEVGSFVPIELYESVAQVLAAVYRADRARSAAAGV